MKFRHVASIIASLFFCLASALAIQIDDFDGSQEATATGPGSVATSSALVATAIGGTRSLKAELVSGDTLSKLRFVTGLGVGQHSQDFGVTGNSTVIWDGDLTTDNLNSTGLGGIDFTQDGGTAIRLTIVGFDYPLSQPVEIVVTVYDASVSDATKFSSASLVINSQVNAPTDFDIPFTDFTTHGPGGAVDFTNVGAIKLFINGQNPNIDLAIDWIGTNGQCADQIPDQNGRVIDECGVCAGDNSTCADCEGVPNGPAVPGTECDNQGVGVCDGGRYDDNCVCVNIHEPGPEICDGLDNDCDGLVDETKDQCNVCGGDGTSCLDCAGVPNGTAVVDRCGVCNGDGTSCLTCETHDQSELLTKMDGGAKKHEALIKRMLRRLGKVDKSLKTKKFIVYAAEEAHRLQIRNWTLSWTLPVVVNQCPGVEFCAEVSNLSILNEYRQHSNELRKLAQQVARKIKRKIGKNRLVKKFLRRNNKIHNDNMALADTVPVTQSVCS
ncbi:MAG: hypothetical protein D6719_10970 [Candidatus Dadabacteria bacterium]|nr:MAG: hypothetical protein D6719_10970 [Candidatus Dadabacteria bacterium]